jgi:hypothetical protein
VEFSAWLARNPKVPIKLRLEGFDRLMDRAYGKPSTAKRGDDLR